MNRTRIMLFLAALCATSASARTEQTQAQDWDSTWHTPADRLLKHVPLPTYPVLPSPPPAQIRAEASLWLPCDGPNGPEIEDRTGIAITLNGSFGRALGHAELEEQGYSIRLENREVWLKYTDDSLHETRWDHLGRVAEYPKRCDNDLEWMGAKIQMGGRHHIGATATPLMDTCRQIVPFKWTRQVRLNIFFEFLPPEEDTPGFGFQWEQPEEGKVSTPQTYRSEQECRAAPVARCFLDQNECQ